MQKIKIDSDVKKAISQIKNQLKNLPDYTESEEKLLVCKSLNLDLKDLILLKEFDSLQLKTLKKVIKKRLKAIPLNKILKKADFYLDEFYINNYVLAPRKETELLVEKVLEIEEKSGKKLEILDLCCGSGAIGLSVAKHSKNQSNLTMLDVSVKAINIAKKNAKTLKVLNVNFVKSNMFSHLKNTKKFDIIASNPPYIATSELNSLQKGVKKYDPNIALDGGDDGLKFYKIIASESKIFLNKDGVVIVEIGYNQAKDVKKLFIQNNFANVEVLKDYSKNDRVIIARL